jgi:hypothetical protein
MDPASIAIRALATYGFLLILIRLSGKRTVREGTSFDFVLALVLGTAVSRAWLSPGRLAAWRTDIESRIGSIGRVDQSGATADRDHAVANLRLHGPAGTVAVSVPLRREQGLWKVTGTPALVEERR